jgi:uncharacterized membrane protein (UPF0127 family)
MRAFIAVATRPIIWRLLAGVVALALTAGAGAFGPARAAETQMLEIATKTGVHTFEVEIATTDAERERGLMYRKSMPISHGMLFDFKQDQNVSMWMKNTYIPLDMIFILSDGRIWRIAGNTTPLSERIISSGGPVRAVLELNGGAARRFGIAPGDKVAHPAFGR